MPRVTYNFPGTTCISISPVIAHGIPGAVILKANDLIHIDVSAELDGYFADTGAPLAVAGKSAFNVIYDLTGHGIGRKLHDKPEAILNYDDPRDRWIMNEGLLLAIEPFLTTGIGRIEQESDGWMLCTTDRKTAAQFEHTVIVTKNEPIILTL